MQPFYVTIATRGKDCVKGGEREKWAEREKHCVGFNWLLYELANRFCCDSLISTVVMIFLSAVNTPNLNLLLLLLRDGVTDWQVVCVYVCICFLWHSPSYPESHLTLLAINQLLNEIFHWANALHNADWKTENRMWRNEISNQQMLWYVNKAIKLCCRCHGFTLRDHFCPCIHGFFLLFPLFLIGTW